MPLTNEDRANAAKMGMEMAKKKVAAPDVNNMGRRSADQMAAAGREEATQASEVGASQTTIDEKTGQYMKAKPKTVSSAAANVNNMGRRAASDMQTDSMKKR